MTQMMISNLPWDLVEEILYRVPLKSLKLVLSTCKKWNVLSNDQRFADKLLAKAAATKEHEFVMIGPGRFDLMSINLHGHDNNIDLTLKRKAKLDVSNPILYTTGVSGVFRCKGLLAFKRNSTFVVWNPYWGKTRWIHHNNSCSRSQMFAFGYNRSCGSHKILTKLEIYDSISDSWRILNATLDKNIEFCSSSASVKGNTYWIARDKEEQGYWFLLCFDFTREIFGPRQPLPFSSSNGKLNASLSSVKEEKLAVFFEGKIWIMNKVESDAVSWSKFLKHDLLRQLPSFGNFMIDEEKKVAVFFYKCEGSNQKAYIFGESGYLSSEYLRDYPHARPCTRMCSFVPSSVQIK